MLESRADSGAFRPAMLPIVRDITRALIAGLLAGTWATAVLADEAPKFAEVRALPPLPPAYEALDDEARLAWLDDALSRAVDAVEVYRLRRVKFNELYYLERLGDAALLCAAHPPLRDDYFYRQRCLMSAAPQREVLVAEIVSLVQEAEAQGAHSVAAQLLADLAWEQSKAGDVASAFGFYESALALAPAEDVELLGTLMMDTATTYIVNGDEAYIRQGIALLDRTRAQAEQALSDPGNTVDPALLRDNIVLSWFNTGIAHALHLHEPAKALEAFERVNAVESPYRPLSLMFSAVSAAEAGDLRSAKRFLDRARAEPTNFLTRRAEISGYLDCYGQLVERTWDASRPVSRCLTLDPETRLEVRLDIVRRLAASDDPATELAGLRELRRLFEETLQPQLRRRGSTAASNTELTRLQRESELKSVVLQQQEALQREREAVHAQRQYFLVALAATLLAMALLVATRLRQKRILAEQYERLSVRDALTQLGNRRFLEQQIERELAHVARSRRLHPEAALGVFLFDIDHFKRINDTLGHRAGDEVLVEMAKRIAVVTRDTDLLVRWGGEEFVLVARVDNPERIGQIAGRIVDAVNGARFEVTGNDALPVTCTVGVVQFPFVDTSRLDIWTRLISLADAALYHGKASGRNGWVLVENVGVRSLDGIDAVLAAPLARGVAEGWVRLRGSLVAGGVAPTADPAPAQ